MRRLLSLCLVTSLAVVLAGAFRTAHAQARRAAPTALTVTEDALHVLVIGDWGRQGQEGQREVAAALGRAARQLDPEFIISTGDNFYPNGVASVDDPNWQQSFEQVYTAHPLWIDWYVVLGNHDYRGNPQAEIDYSSRSRRWRMPSRYYTVSKPVGDSARADFFFLDTSPFIEDYRKEPGKYAVGDQDPAVQLAWLERSLAASTAQWKVVVGHHHIYSGGKRSTLPELERALVPLMARYGVQAYVNGHEHDLQVIRPAGSPVTYFVSGAGSEHRPTGTREGTLFALSAGGFMAFSFTPTALLVQVVDDRNVVRYRTTLSVNR